MILESILHLLLTTIVLIVRLWCYLHISCFIRNPSFVQGQT